MSLIFAAFIDLCRAHANYYKTIIIKRLKIFKFSYLAYAVNGEVDAKKYIFAL